MRFEYYPETDTLYIELVDRKGANAEEIAPDVVADFDEAGALVGLEIDHASRRVDLESLHISDLPVAPVRVQPTPAPASHG